MLTSVYYIHYLRTYKQNKIDSQKRKSLMNKVRIYQVWKSGIPHTIIQLSDGTTLDFRPRDNVRISHSSRTLSNRKIISSCIEETTYSNEELILRAKECRLTWIYFAPTKNCEDFKNVILHGKKISETRNSLIKLSLGAFIGLAILRTI